MSRISYLCLPLSIFACGLAAASVFLSNGESYSHARSMVIDTPSSSQRVEIRPDGVTCFDEAGQTRIALTTKGEAPSITLFRDNGDPLVAIHQRPDGNASLGIGWSQAGPVVQLMADQAEGGKFFLCTTEGQKVALITVVDGNYGTLHMRSVKESMTSHVYCRGLSVLNKKMVPAFFSGVDGYTQPLCILYGPRGDRELELSRIEGHGSTIRFLNDRGTEIINMAADAAGGHFQLNDATGGKVESIGDDLPSSDKESP